MTKQDACYKIEPRPDIFPQQCCESFAPRQSITPVRCECWFCRYADFHLNNEVALDVGVCRYPKAQMD